MSHIFTVEAYKGILKKETNSWNIGSRDQKAQQVTYLVILNFYRQVKMQLKESMFNKDVMPKKHI